ncbi:MAG: hypothetical protein GC150_03625 [Rhizobiales bacterium]|nr:hypothetical protein [Hyphomicrobiales bacterium]
MAAAAIVLLFAGLPRTQAHEAAPGQNGGLRVDAGIYHTELFVDGTTSVVVFLSDVDDTPIPAAGFKATAILIVDGKPQRVALEPGEGSRLVGTAPLAVSPGVKGVVQLTAPDGTTAQGKF